MEENVWGFFFGLGVSHIATMEDNSLVTRLTFFFFFWRLMFSQVGTNIVPDSS